MRGLALSRIAAMMCVALLGMTSAAGQGVVRGDDAQACTDGGGPAIRVNIVGLKDRRGRLKLELYPAREEDFLKDDHALNREGKFFHRSFADTPASGGVALCIKTPNPGTYALFFTHDRDGRNKFDFWKDGAGFPSNRKMGRSRPKLADGIVQVGRGVTTLTIRAQYLRGLSGFGPVGD